MDAVPPAFFGRGEKEAQQERHQHAIGAADERRFYGAGPVARGRERYGQGVAHAAYVCAVS